LSLLTLIRADIEATTHQNFRTHYSALRFWTRAIVKCIVSANVRVVVMYRIAHALAEHRLLPLALILREWGIRSSGAELNPLATIGPGLYIAHSVGVGVGAYVTIGANCRLYLGAVIGPQRSGGIAEPTVIGDGVTIGTHAVVLGGVSVGDGAIIGANATVMRDVEPNAVVSTSPARVVGQRPIPGGSDSDGDLPG
jgi:serine O-acetyltransferase